MYAVERQRWIVDRARAAGRVEVTEIARELDVATETVRRDLGVLERDGLVRRVHGGAVPTERLNAELVLADRDAHHREQKRAIARVSLPLLTGASAVYLDEGSTVRVLAQVWHPHAPVTVVTNALQTASALAGREHVTVILLGGRVRPLTTATVDHWATSMLADITLDLAVLGTNGAGWRHGLTCPDGQVAALKARAIRSARRCAVLADGSKFTTDSLFTFARWESVATLVTDGEAPPHTLELISGLGVEVLRAGAGADEPVGARAVGIP